MSQGFKKATATILAFLITPAIPVIVLAALSRVVEGETEGLLQDPGLLGYLYAISFMLFFFIALPVFLLLLFVRGSIRLWDSIILGLLCGFGFALVFIRSEELSTISHNYASIVGFSATGVLAGIVFWSLLKSGNANVPG